jgi:hypothetical protein
MGKAENTLKSLGFHVGGNQSLIHNIKDQQAEIINKGFARGEQVGRQGLDTSRSRLEGTLSQNAYVQKSLSNLGIRKGGQEDYAKEDDNKDKFGSKYAKQDNSMHSDAHDMEEGHEDAEVVDSVHGADEQENMAVRIGKKVRTASTQLSNPMKIDRTPTNAQYTPQARSAKKSLSQDELFLKALDGIGKMKKGPMKEFIEEEAKEGEHSKGSLKKLRQFDKEEGKEDSHKSKGPCWEGYEKVSGKKNFSEGSCKPVKKSQSVGDICDSLIEIIADPNDPDVIANVHENSNFGQRRVMPETQKSRAPHVPFLKSAGPGGFVFDFGRTTGNPLADNATILLNQNADPTQKQIAEDQERASIHAMTGFVTKGEAAFSGNNSGAGVNDAWAAQMNKPMDQQVQEAFDAGAFAKGGNPAANSANNSAMKKFSKSVGMVNGEQVVAMSETDAAVLEMYKSEQAAMGDTSGMNVVDAQHGGAQRVTIDAGSGRAE